MVTVIGLDRGGNFLGVFTHSYEAFIGIKMSGEFLAILLWVEG